MSNKVFAAILAVIIIAGISGLFIRSRSRPDIPRPGISQDDRGRKHVAQGAAKYGDVEPPTSGDHSEPLPWKYYAQEIDDSNVIHNMEHGGIYISYRPDLPQEQVSKLQKLFFEPYTRKDFTTSKAIMAPRAANDAPIVMSSWQRSQKFQAYDEEAMITYYRKNIGKSPEPTAR